MKYLNFLERYISNDVYGGEVIFLNSNKHYEYYKIIQYLSNDITKVHYVHTNGNLIYNHTGDSFFIEEY